MEIVRLLGFAHNAVGGEGSNSDHDCAEADIAVNASLTITFLSHECKTTRCHAAVVFFVIQPLLFLADIVEVEGAHSSKLRRRFSAIRNKLQIFEVKVICVARLIDELFGTHTCKKIFFSIDDGESAKSCNGCKSHLSL